MEFMPTPAGQATGFFYSAGLGFCLGFVYDLFRIFFYLLTGSDKKLSVVRDIIYLLVFTAADFIFILVICSGRMMLYVFAGQLIGLAAYFYTLGNLIYPPLKSVLMSIRKRIADLISFFGKLRLKICNLYQINEKFSKKEKKFYKKT